VVAARLDVVHHERHALFLVLSGRASLLKVRPAAVFGGRRGGRACGPAVRLLQASGSAGTGVLVVFAALIATCGLEKAHIIAEILVVVKRSADVELALPEFDLADGRRSGLAGPGLLLSDRAASALVVAARLDVVHHERHALFLVLSGRASLLKVRPAAVFGGRRGGRACGPAVRLLQASGSAGTGVLVVFAALIATCGLEKAHIIAEILVVVKRSADVELALPEFDLAEGRMSRGVGLRLLVPGAALVLPVVGTRRALKELEIGTVASPNGLTASLIKGRPQLVVGHSIGGAVLGLRKG